VENECTSHNFILSGHLYAKNYLIW